MVFKEYDLPGLKTVDGIADIDGNYPSKGSGERGAWFRDSEGLSQRPRQSELREDAGVGEPGDRGYPVALEREDEQRVRSRDLRLCIRQVAPEGGLAVRTRRHQPQRRAAPDLAVAQERR